MIKKTFVFIALLNSYISFGQHEQDSVRVSNLLELERLESLLKNARESGDINNEIIILDKLVFFKSGNLQDFTSSYIDAKNLEILIEKNPDIEITNQLKSKLFDYLSWLLQLQDKTNESITYIKKAIKASEDDNNTRQAKNHLIRLAILENDLGNKIVSDSIFAHIEYWALKHEDSEFLAAQYETKSWMNLRIGNNREAIKYANQCLKLSNNLIRTTYNNMSEAYLALNKTDSALIYAKMAYNAVLSIDHLADRAHAHHNLSKSYAALNDFEQAYFHFNEYNKIKEKHNSYKNAQQIGNYNTQLEREKIVIQQALAKEKIANQRLIIWIIIAALCALIAGLYYIFNRLKLINKQKKIIEQEKLRAEQSEKHKEQFLANMSHEIRTPMHAISGMTNTLLRNPHAKDQNPYLEAMKTSSDNLLVLLNDILDLSKIESGKLEIEHEIFNPVQVVKDTIKMLKYKAEEKGLKLQIDIADNFPEQIIGDPPRLTQILINLVGNAIKFTQTGSITIKLSKIDNATQFAITDTGIGIKPEKIKTIFNNFEQGERSRSQIYGGTGLGLSISKKLVELQGGRIWAESTLNKGSSFYFELPLQTKSIESNQTIALHEDALQQMQEKLQNLSILIVDDDEFNVMVVKDDLNYYLKNVTLQVATNGQEAVDTFKQQSFDIILMDMHMPVMNGCQATEIMRSIENNDPRTPIMAMTANSVKSEIAKCLASGMDDYISKPYNPEDLIKKIHALTIIKN